MPPTSATPGDSTTDRRGRAGDPEPPSRAAILAEIRGTLHDLNNALTPVSTNALLLRLLVDSTDSEADAAIDDIVDGAGRASGLMDGLHRLARRLSAMEGAQDAADSAAMAKASRG